MLKLSHSQIVVLARMVAEDVGIPTVSKNTLSKWLTSNPAMPIILCTHGVQLWIDRYYVAYSNDGENYVHYVFISAEHAREELGGVASRIARSDNLSEQKFLKDIQRQLRYALIESKTDYVREDYWNRLKCCEQRAI